MINYVHKCTRKHEEQRKTYTKINSVGPNIYHKNVQKSGLKIPYDPLASAQCADLVATIVRLLASTTSVLYKN